MGDKFRLGENRYRVGVRYSESEKRISVINLGNGAMLKFPRNLMVNLIERRKK